MRRVTPITLFLPAPTLAAAIALASMASADTATDAYRAMGIQTKDVLTGSVLTARVLPGDSKQVVAVVTYMTGKRDEAHAVNVRLEVFRRQGDGLVSAYGRDLGREYGGYVGRGDLQLVDLDGDAVNEVLVTWDVAKDPLVSERRTEVLLWDVGGFRIAWAGPVDYDATRATKTVPADRRDRYKRSLDVGATLKTRGATLVTTKTMLAVAGEKIDPPREVRETFPLRPSPGAGG